MDGGDDTGSTGDDDGSSESDNSGWFSSIINWLANIFDSIGNIASAIGNVISEILTLIFEPLFTFIANVGEGLVTLVTEYLNPFSDNFILVKLWNFFTTLISYVNPFSENFFGYTLIDLLKSALQALFVPEDDYFDNKITELKGELSKKIPVDEYIAMLEETESVAETSTVSDDDSDDINISIDLTNYSLMDKMKLTVTNFIDFSFLSDYRNVWYAWVRVFVYIALVIYNLNEIMKFLRGFNLVNGSGKDVGTTKNQSND